MTGNQTPAQEPRDPINWVLGFAILFLLPPADFIFWDSSLPYGYFLFLKVAAFAGMIYLAYLSANIGAEVSSIKYYIIFGCIAVLYNPFLSVHLPREMWTFVNLATVAVLGHFYLYGYSNRPTNDESLERPEKPTPSVETNISSWPVLTSETSKEKSSEAYQNEDITEVISLIVEPLLLQKALMLNAGDEYLKSLSALGFVSGYTSVFLSRLPASLNLTALEQDMAIAAILEIVFENAERTPTKLYEIQKQKFPEFQEAHLVGGASAVTMLRKGGHKKAGMAWFSHYKSWVNNEDNMPNADANIDPDIEEEENTADDVSFFFFFCPKENPDVVGLRSYLLRAFGASHLSELPSDFKQNRYVAGLTAGYFAIVLDAVKDSGNWSTESKGHYGIIFFTELFNDDNALNSRSLRDKKFALELSQNPEFREGREHGSLLAVAHYDILKAALSEPLIDACRNLSKSTTGMDMPTAVLSLTLQKYVLSEWPNSIITAE